MSGIENLNMKKISLLTFLTLSLILTSCNPESESDNKVTSIGVNEKVLRFYTGNSVSVSDYYENNIHYKVFVNTRGGIDVVNMTKDSLEISKLK